MAVMPWAWQSAGQQLVEQLLELILFVAAAQPVAPRQL